MEERSLKVLANDTTFFNKISVTLTKLLTPTKIGINSMMISIKRSALIKAYEQVASLKNVNDVTKKEQADKRYEESFTLYLESIDRFIMDSIYKKVKNGTASLFEKDALSKYYTIVHLKENEYLEYKYRKQKFLLDLDYQTLKDGSKDKVLSKYQGIYVEKVDGLYKGILKNYSVKLADGIRTKKTNQIQIYKSIFETLEDYIKTILPIKLKNSEMPSYEKVLKEYEEYEKFSVGKLDEKEVVEKNPKVVIKREPKPRIEKYTLDGQYVCTYENAIHAAADNNVYSSAIHACARKKTRRCGDFIYRYEGDTLDLPDFSQSTLQKRLID